MSTSATSPAYDVDIEDIEYASYEGRPLLGRAFKPRGSGPHPLLVEIHGGAWNSRDRLSKCTIKEEIAKRGVGVFAIDFRMPPADAYPAALADVNYAIRWVKANAALLNTAPDAVGVMGSSSGGHLAVLTALRPYDARYLATPNPTGSPDVDATVRCAIGLWPVISPLGRYHYAKQMVSLGLHVELSDSAIPGHQQFWKTEDAMSEGDPVLMLERGEKCVLPPLLCIQSPNDPHHPLPYLERFASLYHQAGGEIALEVPGVDETPHVSVTLDDEPSSASTSRILARLTEFVRASVG